MSRRKRQKTGMINKEKENNSMTQETQTPQQTVDAQQVVIPQESERMLGQINGFFELVAQMRAVDTTGVEPLAHPVAAVQDGLRRTIHDRCQIVVDVRVAVHVHFRAKSARRKETGAHAFRAAPCSPRSRRAP